MILTIFGYPKAGKTLLFNLLTGKKEEVSKFSTSTHEYHKAVVDVPDERLTRLAGQFDLPPIYAKIEYLDTGAIAFGESKNETFIDLLRRADGLVHVIRGFEDPEIPHPPGEVDPRRDIRAIEEELKAVDFLSIEKRLEKLQADIKKIKSKELQDEFEIMTRLKAFLEEGKPLIEFEFKAKEEIIIRGFKFLSIKPLIHIINADENTYDSFLPLRDEQKKNRAIFVFCAKIEDELLALEEDDRKMFQDEYGLHEYEYMKENFVEKSYRLMNLISFFTMGKKEFKAWTINNTENAHTAAGKIHTDIQEGFIRGETINWQDFLDAGGFSQAKEKGVLRLEGKEYIVRDGDVIQFRFNK
ncbi:DUF933 domain-containing protein [Acidobacteriota bacterium]